MRGYAQLTNREASVGHLRTLGPAVRFPCCSEPAFAIPHQSSLISRLRHSTRRKHHQHAGEPDGLQTLFQKLGLCHFPDYRTQTPPADALHSLGAARSLLVPKAMAADNQR